MNEQAKNDILKIINSTTASLSPDFIFQKYQLKILTPLLNVLKN